MCREIGVYDRFICGVFDEPAIRVVFACLADDSYLIALNQSSEVADLHVEMQLDLLLLLNCVGNKGRH